MEFRALPLYDSMNLMIRQFMKTFLTFHRGGPVNKEMMFLYLSKAENWCGGY